MTTEEIKNTLSTGRPERTNRKTDSTMPATPGFKKVAAAFMGETPENAATEKPFRVLGSASAEELKHRIAYVSKADEWSPEKRLELQHQTDGVQRIEFENGEYRCQISDLPIWNDEYRMAYLYNFQEKVFGEKKGYLTIEIDMRLLKLFNDRYGESTADLAIKQFVKALTDMLDTLIKSDSSGEYYLYKMHGGGDDFSLGVSGSLELLEKIIAELPPFLDLGVNNFTAVNKNKQVQVTPLGAECGWSLIRPGEEPREHLQKIQQESKYPEERRRDLRSDHLGRLDHLHDLVETHKHVANVSLTQQKFFQILKELTHGEDVLKDNLIPAINEILNLYDQHFEDLILSLLTPSPEEMSEQEVADKITALSERLMVKPLTGIAETEGEVIQYRINNLIEQSYSSLSSVFGERRKTAAGEYYTSVLHRRCQETQTKILDNTPLPIHLLTFFEVISHDAAANIATYVSQLIQRQLQLMEQSSDRQLYRTTQQVDADNNIEVTKVVDLKALEKVITTTPKILKVTRDLLRFVQN